MPDVRKLQAEAEKKGLHGEAEQRYVGGVFNRIRQAHARAHPPLRTRFQDAQEAAETAYASAGVSEQGHSGDGRM